MGDLEVEEELEPEGSKELELETISDQLEKARNQDTEVHHDETPVEILDELEDGNRLYNRVLAKASDHLLENPGKTMGAGALGGIGTGLAATGQPRWAFLGAVAGGMGSALGPLSYKVNSVIKRRDNEFEASRELGKYEEVEEGWYSLIQNSNNLRTDLINAGEDYPDEELEELVVDRLAREEQIGEAGVSAVISSGHDRYEIVFYNDGREITSVRGEIEDSKPQEYVETGDSLDNILQDFTEYVDREVTFHYR